MRVLRFTGVFLSGSVLAAVALGLSGARINRTSSIPQGLYWTTAEPVEAGSYVIFCPPPTDLFMVARRRGYVPNGSCPGELGFMMKRVAAVGGDSIRVDASGMYVNGKMIPATTPAKFDSAGQPLPRLNIAERTLVDGELLLVGDASSLSFDSRYFGPIGRNQITSTIRPVLVEAQ
jgi:conjugative transfer signal peptidase TraF